MLKFPKTSEISFFIDNFYNFAHIAFYIDIRIENNFVT